MRLSKVRVIEHDPIDPRYAAVFGVLGDDPDFIGNQKRIAEALDGQIGVFVRIKFGGKSKRFSEEIPCNHRGENLWIRHCFQVIEV